MAAYNEDSNGVLDRPHAVDPTPLTHCVDDEELFNNYSPAASPTMSKRQLEEEASPPIDFAVVKHKMRSGASQLPCRKDEDTFILGSDVGVFAVFDGHGGRGASTYCKDNFIDSLRPKGPNAVTLETLDSVVLKTCKDLDSHLCSTDEYSGAGSTMGCVIVSATEDGGCDLGCYWLGDSRILVTDLSGQVLWASTDHCPRCPSEVVRKLAVVLAT